MAGFGFSMRAHEEDLDLLEALLRLTQRQAGSMGDLDVRFRREERAGWRVQVDGRMYQMQTLIRPLRWYLPAYADGASAGHAARQRRLNLAYRLARRYEVGVVEITQSIFELAGKVAGTPGLSMYFEESGDAVTDARLEGFTTLLIAFEMGDATGEHIVEDCHTVIELMMGRLLGGRARGLSFQQRADALVADGRLTPEMREAVVSLKDTRKRAKHRGAEVPRDEAAPLVAHALSAVHHLRGLIAAGS